MEQKNKNILWVIVSFILLILSILPWTVGFLAVPRGGYCEFGDIFDGFRIVASILLLLSIFCAVRVLKNSKKIMRILSILILFFSLALFIFSLYVYIENIMHIGCTGREVGIMASISELRKSGEGYAKINNGSYTNFCNNDEVAKIRAFAEQSSYSIYCNENSEEWAVCSQLKFWKGDYSCSDSNGNMKRIKGRCDENWEYAQCPI